MEKIKEFLKKVVCSLKNFGSADEHCKKLFLYELLFGFFIGLFLGLIPTVVLMGLFGIGYEITHYFVPLKKYIIFGHEVELPNYKELHYDLVLLKPYYDFDKHGIVYLVGAMMVYAIVKIFLMLL